MVVFLSLSRKYVSETIRPILSVVGFTVVLLEVTFQHV